MKIAALTEPLAVACHDVRRAELVAGETAVVIGGGPIGLLVALVAQAPGARSSSARSTRNASLRHANWGWRLSIRGRRRRARACSSRTAPEPTVVFEVSGSPAGALQMTELACLRGRLVVVAIFPEPQPVRLFDFFWKELQLRGARVYEPEDYERAIALVAEGRLPLDRLITAVEPLDRLPAVFAENAHGSSAMKILVDCRS